jgi:2'-5' RNA ligase
MNKIRTFIAVEPSREVRGNLQRLMAKLAPIGTGYNWVEPAILHLTLNFLGDIQDRDVPGLCRAVENAVEGLSAFELSLKSVGWFPPRRHPQVIWIGTDSGSLNLMELHHKLSSVCEGWCAKQERKNFIPHLTLARLKRGARWNEALLTELDRLQSFHAGSFLVDKIIVFSSFLERSGPTHTSMATIKLNP